MKLPPRDAAGYFSKPDVNITGVLIYGPNAMRVAIKRQALVKALIGPDGASEMRLTRIAAALNDAIKAVGFFPGPRVVLVEDANDNCAPAILAGLQDWETGDAQLVVTGGQLKPTSKIRKAFEAHSNAYAIAIYDDPPSRAEIEAQIAKAGLTNVSPDATAAINALATTMDPGEFDQFLEKLAVYCMGDSDPVSINDITECVPQSTEAAMDDVIHAVAELRTADLASILQRVTAQGISPTGLCIGALRHFRTLHTAASDPGGSSAGIGKLRPPVYGPRRDRLQRQAQKWGRAKLEQAIGMLLTMDLELRSAGQTAPQMAQVERCFVRLSMMGKQ
ncbi:MAG: DNA polymerase III subunit delta [Planktomarina sp.]